MAVAAFHNQDREFKEQCREHPASILFSAPKYFDMVYTDIQSKQPFATSQEAVKEARAAKAKTLAMLGAIEALLVMSFPDN